MIKLCSLARPDPSSLGGIITCSIGAYTASHSALTRNRIRPCETINDRANL